MTTPSGRPSGFSRGRSDPSSSLAPTRLVIIAGLVLMIGCLHWAREVLVPVALAVLLTFMLAPVVTALERWRVPRVPAVVLVVLLSLGVLGGVGTLLVTQVVSLGAELPRYKDNIKEKISDLRGLGRNSGLEPVRETVTSAAGEVERDVEKAQPPVAKQPKPTPVVVHPGGGSGVLQLPAAVVPWLDPITRAGLVALLVPFMLLSRHELRNRMVRLVGFSRLAVTTRALDEAGERVSRYLLTQGLVNATFGTLVGVGLFVLGVPYALLFGFLGGALRFIPYVGVWIGAGLPIAMSMAVFPGWGKALLVLGLFAILELFTAAVLEVLLYARSAGVSEVGLLVAIAFWAWVWGPIGLLLATPLTVCLVVFAKYVPELEFIWIAMGDSPVFSTDVLVYQRLLAEDSDEASDVVERYAAEHDPAEVYDTVLLPVVLHAVRDRSRGRIDDAEERAVVAAVREIVDEQGESAGAPGGASPRIAVFGCAARSEADAAALHMLRELLAPSGVDLDVGSADRLSAELVHDVRESGVGVVVVASLPPGGLAQARYLCKRLRASVPEVKIVVGRWCAPEDAAEVRASLTAAGADTVGTRLLEVRDAVLEAARTQSTATPRRAA
jgi:predicted PurR-regulated permease PerM/methylmalonyl-CoA mutase cobalamin-binding subunit